MNAAWQVMADGSADDLLGSGSDSSSRMMRMAVGKARLRPQTKAYGAARATLFAYSRQEWPPFIAAEERVPSAYCVDALVGKHGFSEVSRSLHKLDLHSRRHP